MLTSVVFCLDARLLDDQMLTHHLFRRRTRDDCVELTEESLDFALTGANLRLRFVGGGHVLPGVSVHEAHGHVLILVPTSGSVHRLVFPHPNKLHRHVGTRAQGVHTCATSGGSTSYFRLRIHCYMCASHFVPTASHNFSDLYHIHPCSCRTPKTKCHQNNENSYPYIRCNPTFDAQFSGQKRASYPRVERYFIVKT